MATTNPPPPSVVAKELLIDLTPIIKVYTDGTIERESESPLIPPSAEDPTTGVSSKDTTISPDVSARIYLPKRTTQLTDHDQKLPVLVYYHAGGFCMGSAFASLDHHYINILSATTGALVISVEYRLAPEHPLPAAYEDSWDAFRWVCSHGVDEAVPFKKDEWITDHGDLNRIFICGDSAGGNIAHNVTMRVGSSPPPETVKIVGAILLHPYFWGSNPIGSETKEDVEQSLPYRIWMFAYPSVPGGIDNPLVNPVADGAPGLSGLGCSKMIVVLAEKDELKGRGLIYVEKVKKSDWKGEIEAVEVEGEDHCFQLFDPESEKATALIKRLSTFISY